MTKELKIHSYDYLSVINSDYWKNYLGRDLSEEEDYILSQTKNEKKFNERIENIFKLGKTKNLYIPVLTKMRGNCIFECLQYFKLCDNITAFRQGIAIMMFIFKKQKNFIPGQELTLEELFGIRIGDKIPYVWCSKTQKLYKYNYDAMCIDLGTEYSWTRVDTQMMLTFISVFLNLKILILHDNDMHITEICTKEDKNTMTIHLGLIKEVHYIPLDYIHKNKKIDDYKCLKYNEALKYFHNWAKTMAISLNRVTYEGNGKIKSTYNKIPSKEIQDNTPSKIHKTISTKNDTDNEENDPSKFKKITLVELDDGKLVNFD